MSLKKYIIITLSVMLLNAWDSSASRSLMLNGRAFAQETESIQEAESTHEPDLEVEKAHTERSKEDLVKAGKFYYNSKKYEAAIKEWEEALSIDPKSKKIKKYIDAAKKKLRIQAKEEKRRERKEEKDLISVTAPPKKGLPVYTLDECIRIAVKNNIPLQIAEKNIKLGEIRIWQARRNLLPTLSARWEESEGRVSARRYVGKKEYIEGQQTLPILQGGELYYIMRQAEINLEIVKKDYDRIKNDLILQVRKGYYTLAKSKENLKIQSALSQEVEKIFEMAKQGFDAGVVSKLEFLNVNSQAIQLKFQLTSAKGDEDVAGLILKQGMNVDLKEDVEIEPKLEFKKIEVDFDTVLKAAFIYRPEMSINSLTLEYYKYEQHIAGAKGWPKIDLMGNWGLAKEEFVSEDAVVGDDRKLSQQWYAGAKVILPLWGSTAEYSLTREQWTPVVSAFQGTEATTKAVRFNLLDNMKYFSDKRDAEIGFDRARQELNKSRQDITLEVREGCFSYEKAIIQLEVSSEKVKYQESDLELTRLRRSMDEALDSNVIDSMIKLSQERFGYIQALTDYFIALASLNKAIGAEDYFKTEESEEK